MKLFHTVSEYENDGFREYPERVDFIAAPDAETAVALLKAYLRDTDNMPQKIVVFDLNVPAPDGVTEPVMLHTYTSFPCVLTIYPATVAETKENT